MHMYIPPRPACTPPPPPGPHILRGKVGGGVRTVWRDDVLESGDEVFVSDLGSSASLTLHFRFLFRFVVFSMDDVIPTVPVRLHSKIITATLNPIPTPGCDIFFPC
jgi:hypothetical protein